MVRYGTFMEWYGLTWWFRLPETLFVSVHVSIELEYWNSSFEGGWRWDDVE